tara:strand:- start:8313 stop:8576 length:264 start_codon:yes stop_codon:yes gene_type:complete
MPKYLYKCEICEEMFLAYHLMSEKLEKREGCEKDCQLRRLPMFPVNIKKTNKQSNIKPGELVKDFIKDAKEDLKNEKKNLKEKEYEI